MNCPRAVFVNSGAAGIDRVYTFDQKRQIAELTDLAPEVADREGILSGKFADAEVIFSTWGMVKLSAAEWGESMPKLKAVFYAAGATDHFVRPLLERGVRVFSAWQANAIPVAEFCVAQILLGMKGYFRNSRESGSPEKFRNRFVGPGSYGESVALIGAGAISARIQELLKPFDLKVVVIPSRKERRTVSLEEAFRSAFVVSNHLPDRDDNVGVIHAGHFTSMREGAVFINTGRGRQVDEAGLIDVFKRRSDLTALLDVTFPEPPEEGSELYSLPNIHLSSHIAGSLGDEVHRMADYMIGELKRHLAGETPCYEVTERMLLTSK